MARVLDLVREARERDVQQLVNAELKRRGIAVDATGAVRAATPTAAMAEQVQVDAGPDDDGDGEAGCVGDHSAEAGDGEQKPKRFADVLKTFMIG